MDTKRRYEDVLSRKQKPKPVSKAKPKTKAKPEPKAKATAVDINTLKKDIENSKPVSKDRGPRTDHGGGEDGDDWADEEQIEEWAQPFRESKASRLNKKRI